MWMPLLSIFTDFFFSFYFGFSQYFSNFPVQTPITCRFWFRRPGVMSESAFPASSHVTWVLLAHTLRSKALGTHTFPSCLDQLASLIWTSHAFFSVQTDAQVSLNLFCVYSSAESVDFSLLMRLCFWPLPTSLLHHCPCSDWQRLSVLRTDEFSEDVYKEKSRGLSI